MCDGTSWLLDDFDGVFDGVLFVGWLPDVVDSIDKDDTLLVADINDAFNGGVVSRSNELLRELQLKGLRRNED